MYIMNLDLLNNSLTHGRSGIVMYIIIDPVPHYRYPRVMCPDPARPADVTGVRAARVNANPAG